jgi:ubiquinone biosynthesis protein COQ4
MFRGLCNDIEHHQVHYIDDPELAYTMQRYRECHDFYHALFSLPVSVESELALKWFEYVHFGLPMAALGAIFGPLRLDANKRARLFREYVPWAMRCGASAKPLIAVYWEERWEMTTEELKRELGVWDPPAAIWGKALSEKQREQRRREAEQRREQKME